MKRRNQKDTTRNELKTGAKNFTHSIASGRYAKADRLKMSRNVYFSDIASSYYAGALYFYELIEKELASKKFTDPLELVGFMHEICKPAFDDFVLNHSNGKVRARSLEEYIEGVVIHE